MPYRKMVFVAAVAICAIAAVAAQIDPRTALVERAAWEALGKGQARQAASAFREAIAADPKNARLHLGSGIAAMLERRDRDAGDAFETALALDPKLTEARARLGVVRYRMGDTAGAIRTYETLVADVPSDADAQATLDRWRREQDLHDRMQNAIGSHFTVSFEGPAEAALAKQALESLDRAYWRIGEELGTYPSDPVRVVLYTTEQFRDITRSPTWVAGAYDGTIRVPMLGAIDKAEELDRVLAHEFIHAVVRTLAARNVPTDKTRAVPLRALQNGFTRFNGDQAVLAYAASARAVRRLLDEAGGFAVANLLRDLGEGIGLDAAFLHRFQRPFTDFQAELAES